MVWLGDFRCVVSARWRIDEVDVSGKFVVSLKLRALADYLLSLAENGLFIRNENISLLGENAFLSDKGEFLRWIESAKRTLRSAEGDLERGDYNWTCFKAQQVAEMAVKALLHGLGLPAYGHSVSRLLSDLVSREVSVSSDIMRSAKVLDRHYVPTRYPNVWAEGAPHEYYTGEDAEEALSHAEKVLRWVEEVWRYLERGGE